MHLNKIYYWGLRNLKDHSFIVLGQQQINVKIEIGDQSLEPNVIEKCPSNGNFQITHRKYCIVSPLGDSRIWIISWFFWPWPGVTRGEWIQTTFEYKMRVFRNPIFIQFVIAGETFGHDWKNSRTQDTVRDVHH